MAGIPSRSHARLMCGAAGAALLLWAGAAQAQTTARVEIAPQSLASALNEFGVQTGYQVIFAPTLTGAKATRGVSESGDIELALNRLLEGSGLSYRRDADTFLIVKADSVPQSGSAAGGGAEVEALIVTAQKKEEAIQDVPIAISAFTQKNLEEQKIEGGFDLVKAVPNVTFSKNNFSGYNFSIRGIGTKAISVTTDPGVAVSFNSTPLIRNRLFEQEYFDLERVEVLRGPQGTLYGRNATAGVINVISAKPDFHEFKGSIKAEVGNYDARRMVAMVNVPVVDDVLALRLAGAMTQRDGFSINLYDNSRQDGRDLWSARLTLGFKPNERVRANLIWERFEEDDNRARTGKQLCTPDPGPEMIGDRTIVAVDVVSLGIQRGIYSQGCLPKSIYDDAAFGAPNGFALPFIQALAQQISGSIGRFVPQPGDPEYPHTGRSAAALIYGVDPYGGITQSRDLRAIYSQIKPIYRANADVFELNVDFDITDALTLTSQTAYNKDRIYATQDFNRYTTVPSFTDTTKLAPRSNIFDLFQNLSPGGVFCDPQLGCSNTIVGQDLSRAKSQQFSQEFRLQSDFNGPLNFSVGANYTKYDTVEDYYVFFNAITLAAIVSYNANNIAGTQLPDRFTTNPDCMTVLPRSRFACVPIENNSIANIQDTGHNYFLSRNPYKLWSKSVFGEAYWEFEDNLKVTAGLRYTDDKKTFSRIPSETMLTPKDYAFLDRFPPEMRPTFTGRPFYGLGFGYPALPDVTRQWQEFTGRIGVDWKPDLTWSDQTMIYAFYSHGYKGGGMNPPQIGLNYDDAAAIGLNYTPSAPLEFRPEFVNAYEMGVKNTFLGGGLILNASMFYYDYRDYQVSKIVDRSAQNENFDAKVWGLEIESLFSPTRNLRFNASLGYLDTELAEGSKSIDIMNRTAGHADWILVKPAMTLPSNCIVPLWVAEIAPVASGYEIASSAACPGGALLGDNYGTGPLGQTLPDGSHYDPADHPEANYGAGFDTDVSGNELPNSPHWTVTLGGQYSREFGESWKATIRADFYWQSQQWSRVYALPIDKLRAWKNGNLSLLIERPDDGLAFELYAKNIFDDTPITDTFTNSDDTALTTNIFVLDPRLIGLSIKKTF